MEQGEVMGSRPITILLVEDSLAHAELVVRGLEDHPLAHTIYHVTDGQEALDYLFRTGIYTDPKNSPRPDLVLLDLRLPKIGGLDILEQIKTSKELQKIPVVILSTSGAEKDIELAYERHANSYVIKPNAFGNFKDLMQELGFYWLGWSRLPDPVAP